MPQLINPGDKSNGSHHERAQRCEHVAAADPRERTEKILADTLIG
jgi:hypothetical protein